MATSSSRYGELKIVKRPAKEATSDRGNPFSALDDAETQSESGEDTRTSPEDSQKLEGKKEDREDREDREDHEEHKNKEEQEGEDQEFTTEEIYEQSKESKASPKKDVEDSQVQKDPQDSRDSESGKEGKKGESKTSQDETKTKSLREELADDSETERPHILFVKIRNATFDQVRTALLEIGDPLITIKRDREGRPAEAAFICMQNSKQSEYLLQHGFEIDFTKEQLEMQKEQIKKAIEMRKKKARFEGIDPATVKEYDETRGVPPKQFMYVDVADTRSPSPEENGKSLYISNLPGGDLELVQTVLMETLLRVGDVEDLRVCRNKNTPGHYAFARFSGRDAEYAFLMMKDHELKVGEVSSILSANYAWKQDKKKAPKRESHGYGAGSYNRGGAYHSRRESGGHADTSEPESLKSDGSWR
jgi:hypothetical protein